MCALNICSKQVEFLNLDGKLGANQEEQSEKLEQVLPTSVSGILGPVTLS